MSVFDFIVKIIFLQNQLQYLFVHWIFKGNHSFSI